MIATRTALRAAGVLGTAGALVLLATPATADNHTATVSVLHAVPDTPVDVYVNGERLIDDFQPGTLTDPLQLPAGYELAVQTISGAHSAPSGVPGGTAGLVDDGSLPTPVAALSVIGLVAATAGALRLARSRG